MTRNVIHENSTQQKRGQTGTKADTPPNSVIRQKQRQVMTTKTHWLLSSLHGGFKVIAINFTILLFTNKIMRAQQTT